MKKMKREIYYYFLNLRETAIRSYQFYNYFSAVQPLSACVWRMLLYLVKWKLWFGEQWWELKLLNLISSLAILVLHMFFQCSLWSSPPSFIVWMHSVLQHANEVNFMLMCGLWQSRNNVLCSTDLSSNISLSSFLAKMLGLFLWNIFSSTCSINIVNCPSSSVGWLSLSCAVKIDLSCYLKSLAFCKWPSDCKIPPPQNKQPSTNTTP